MSIAAHLNLKITQLDVVTSFLNGNSEEEIFMEQPVHFDDGTKRYCKLQKCIYGLKQSNSVWNQILDQVLIEFGLMRSLRDQCIYYNI